MNISPNIRWIGSLLRWPLEALSKLAFGGRPYMLSHTVRWFDVHTGRWQKAWAGMRHDRATLAPNLRKADGTESDAFPIHDVGWEHGKWITGDVLTFDQNNQMLYDILCAEGHPLWICRLYYAWVSKDFMRTRWEARFGNDIQRVSAGMRRKTAHLMDDHAWARPCRDV